MILLTGDPTAPLERGCDEWPFGGRSFALHRDLEQKSLKTKANAGALIVRMEVWAPVSYTYHKEPLRNSMGNYLGFYITLHRVSVVSAWECLVL